MFEELDLKVTDDKITKGENVLLTTSIFCQYTSKRICSSTGHLCC